MSDGLAIRYLNPDATAPESTIVRGLTQGAAAGFEWTGSDNFSSTDSLTYSYRLDDGAWSAYSSDTTTILSALADGGHTFEVRAKDEAGNVDVSPAERTFTVETVAPTGTVTINNGAALTNNRTVSLTLSASDPEPGSTVVSMQFHNTGGAGWSAWEPFSTTKTWPLLLSNGARTVNARFRDGAGNVSGVRSDSITLDTVKPLASPPTSSYPVTLNGRHAHTRAGADDVAGGNRHGRQRDRGLPPPKEHQRRRDLGRYRHRWNRVCEQHSPGELEHEHVSVQGAVC
ncbi:MAG: hypothetical protein WKH64_15635 [Chloroflexia bacterium]